MPKGIRRFVKNLPDEYRTPTLIDELYELKYRLRKAKNACDVGGLTYDILGHLFETEFEWKTIQFNKTCWKKWTNKQNKKMAPCLMYKQSCLNFNETEGYNNNHF